LIHDGAVQAASRRRLAPPPVNGEPREAWENWSCSRWRRAQRTGAAARVHGSRLSAVAGRVAGHRRADREHGQPASALRASAYKLMTSAGSPSRAAGSLSSTEQCWSERSGPATPRSREIDPKLEVQVAEVDSVLDVWAEARNKRDGLGSTRSARRGDLWIDGTCRDRDAAWLPKRHGHRCCEHLRSTNDSPGEHGPASPRSRRKAVHPQMTRRG